MNILDTIEANIKSGEWPDAAIETSLRMNGAKFIEACKAGYLYIAKWMLEHGADVHARDDEALQWAAGNGYSECVKLLLAAGADVHADDDYALRYAAYNGHPECVKLLLEAGADVHADMDIPLWSAVFHNNFECAEILLEAGADIHAVEDSIINLMGRTNLKLQKLIEKYI